MRKTAIRFLSMIIVSILLVQNVFATGSVTIKNKPAETIGRVPEEFQSMVNGNWAIASGDFSDDGYYTYNSRDGKVEVVKYDLYGKKQYETEYAYKYAGKDKKSLFYFRHHVVYQKFVNENGDSFITSRVNQSIPLLEIDLSSKHNLVKIDSKGNIVWRIDFSKKDAYVIRSVVELDDGSLILGVTRKTKWIKADNADYIATLIKVSADGDIIKKVDLRDGITMIDVLACVEGKGFLSYVREISVVDDEFEEKQFLCAFDKELNQLWEIEIGKASILWDINSVSEYGYPIMEKTDKEIPLYQQKSMNIKRIGFDKNVLSEYTIETKNQNEHISNIFFLNNGDYVVEYSCDYYEDIHNEQSRFILHSQNSKETKELPLIGYSMYDFVETETERIFCCWNALSYYDGGGVDDRECVYTAFDMDWNLLWQKGVKE